MPTTPYQLAVLELESAAIEYGSRCSLGAINSSPRAQELIEQAKERLAKAREVMALFSHHLTVK